VHHRSTATPTEVPATETSTPGPTSPPPPTSARPAATATPLGGGVGPQLFPPGTGSGSDGGFPWASTAWVLMGAAGAAALAGGLYLRVARAGKRSSGR
jgi:hypothetical protein